MRGRSDKPLLSPWLRESHASREREAYAPVYFFFSTWLTNYRAYLERLYTLSKKVTNTERFSPESSGMFWIRA